MDFEDIQLDMFGEPVPVVRDEPKVELKGAPAPATGYEAMAVALEASGLYRISRKLVAPAVVAAPRAGFPRIGVVVDTETTGFSAAVCDAIEIGAVAFTYNDHGEIGDVIATYSSLQMPTAPIPKAITALTGITDEMVAGQAIDEAQLRELIDPADLVIAHNAGFDRPFCEKLSAVFAEKAWACSVADIDWSSRGFEGTKLGYLVGQAGLFHDGHRAIDDCFALLAILSAPAVGGSTPFAELHRSGLRSRGRIFAQNSPFDMKDVLKARGYRWSDGTGGMPKAWWIEVAEAAIDGEREFLRSEVYRRADAEPIVMLLTPANRFKK